MPESKCHDVSKPRRGITLIAPPFKAGYDVESTKLISFFSADRKGVFKKTLGKMALRKEAGYACKMVVI